MAFLRLFLEADVVTIDTLVTVLRASGRVLGDVDRNTRLAPDAAFDWQIASIHSGSPIDTLLRSVPRNGTSDAVALTIARNTVSGLATLERDESIPENFGDEGLRAVAQLGLQLRRGDLRLRATALDSDRQETADTWVTPVIRQHAQASRTPASDSIGSLVGLLHAIDVGHAEGPGRKPSVSVLDERRRRSIRCYIERERVQEFRDRDLLGRRVMVGGIVKRNARGQVVHVDLRRIRTVTRPEDIPSADALMAIAPEITDGLPAEDYLHEQRHG